MHAVARLALNPLITNIQTSWVKMGPEGVKACLRSGANDLGGTLMDETITRSAGASHAQRDSVGGAPDPQPVPGAAQRGKGLTLGLAVVYNGGPL